MRRTFPKHREQTEVRGPDEVDDIDWPTGDRPAYYPVKRGTYVSQKQLEERSLQQPSDPGRCWCGRPQSVLAGVCNQGHPWPRE